jgi:hypothetical protein
MTELKEFKLPDVGEGLTEADIVAWHVKPGDQVEVNQIIVAIETAKAVVELPSPWDGTVARLLAEEGQTVDVGTPIITVEVAGSGPAPTSEKTNEAERSVVPATGQPERQAVLVGYGVKTSSTTRRARKTVPAAAPIAPQALAPDLKAARAPPGRWRSRRSAGWPRTSASAWPPWRAPGRTARLPGMTCSGRPLVPPFVREILWWETGAGPAVWLRRIRGPARAARSASRSGACVSTWPRPWCRARSPRRTSPSSCRST